MSIGLERLRKSYDGLSPFERATLFILESVNRRRLREAEALIPSKLGERLNTELFQGAIVTTSAFALIQSLYAGRMAAEHERDDPELARLHHAHCCAWIMALQRLGQATGAPFVPACKLFLGDYAERTLKISDKQFPGLDASPEFEGLESLWNAFTGKGDV